MTIRVSIAGGDVIWEKHPNSRMRFSRQVAEELLHRYGAFAHMHALEAMESREQKHSRKLWRDVLTTLDEIINERKQDDKPELRTAEADKP
jgi:mannose/cellobiose epimerase-like protein (N-acyl-D-glucosamine 2-epimerase family)